MTYSRLFFGADGYSCVLMQLPQSLRERKGEFIMAENKFENLSRFAVNLNERAAQGKLDPVIGRDEEIRRVLQILSRRTKNNPILVRVSARRPFPKA